jgi:hypothetical protein
LTLYFNPFFERETRPLQFVTCNDQEKKLGFYMKRKGEEGEEAKLSPFSFEIWWGKTPEFFIGVFDADDERGQSSLARSLARSSFSFLRFSCSRDAFLYG